MRKVLVILAALSAVLALGTTYLLNSTQGLRWAVALLQQQVPGKLEIKQADGRLIGPIELRGLVYQDTAGLRLTLETVVLDWLPGQLLDPRLVVSRIEINQMRVDLAETADEPQPNPIETLPSVSAPVPMELRALHLTEVQILSADGHDIASIARVDAAASWEASEISIKQLDVEERRVAAKLSGTVRAEGSYPNKLRASWRTPTTGEIPGSAGSIALDGDLNALRAVIALQTPTAATAEIEVARPLTDLKWQALIRAAPNSLNNINTAWPDWRVGGEVKANGDLDTLQAAATVSAARGDSTFAPISIDAEFKATSVSGTPSWQALITTSGVSAQALDPSLPEWQLGAQIKADGGLTELRAQTTVDATQAGRRYVLTTTISGTAPAWEIEDLELTDPDTGATLTAAGRLQTGTEIEFVLTGGWRQLAWPPTGTADWRSESGSFAVDGTPEQFAAKLNGVIEGFQVAASLKRAGPNWKIKELTADQPRTQGRARVSADVSITDGAARFDVSGDWRNIQWPNSDQPHWRSPSGTLTLVGVTGDFDLDIDGLLATLDPAIGQSEPGPLKVQAKVRGLPGLPQVDGTVRVPSFESQRLALNSLAATVKFDATDKTPSAIDVAAQSLRIDDNDLAGLELGVTGTMTEHSVALSAVHEQVQMRAAVAASYRDNQWRGQLTRWQFEGLLGRRWRLDQAAAFAVSANSVTMERLCLSGDKTRLCGEGAWRAGQTWQAKIALDELPTQTLAQLWQPELEWSGMLAGELSVSGGENGALLGDGRIRAGDGTLAWQSEDESNRLSYRDLVVDLAFEPESAKIQISGGIDENGRLDGQLIMGQPLTAAANPSLNGRIDAQLPTLDWVEILMPRIRASQGTLKLRADVGGTFERPEIEAQGEIANARLQLTELGIELRELNLRAQTDTSQKVALSGKTRSGDGELELDGTVDFSTVAAWMAQLQTRGKRVEVTNLPEARIIASPDLKIELSPRGVAVAGTVTVDEAKIEPELSAPSVTLSSDVVIVTADAPAETEKGLPLNADILLKLGGKVTIDGFGLAAGLRGQLRIVERPGKVALATGEINLVDGTYSVYGQKLKVDEGRLVFAGSAINNPGIEARAVRVTGDVTAGVTVGGTARKPTLDLFSDPTLPDSEKLSYLLLGRPTNQASGAEGALLFRAATSLLPGKSGQMQERLKSTFGLDTLALESANGNEEEGASVLLGKYLSPRLYVSYAAGLADTLNVFKVRYELTKSILLQTESSTKESGGDVLYRIER